MDDIDRQLLALLRDNGRASFTELAKTVGTSEGTVRARMKRLSDEGIIQKFTVRLAGNHVKALIEVEVESNLNMGAATSAIATWPGVEAVYEVTGDHDIVVVAECPDPNTLNELIDRIRDIKGTKATRSRLILRSA